MSNTLDPDQDGHSVGPYLGPNCLQRFSAEDKSPGWQGKSKKKTVHDPAITIKGTITIYLKKIFFSTKTYTAVIQMNHCDGSFELL